MMQPPRPAPPAPAPRRRAAAAAALVLAVLVAAAGACSASGDDPAAAPSTLPATSFVDLRTGEAVDLAAYRGTPVLVNLWATWCTPCRTEMPALQEAADRWAGRVQVVGVSDDGDREATLEAADTAGVSYPLLVDTSERLQADLGVTGLPASVFLDGDGNVVELHAGVLDAGAIDETIGRLYGLA